jgi:hypothetical protein
MATEAKLAPCDNIVSASSLAPPAVLIALSDIPRILGPLGVILPSSRMPHNEMGPQPPQFAAKSSELGASRAATRCFAFIKDTCTALV